jgi:hypothetical protein
MSFPILSVVDKLVKAVQEMKKTSRRDQLNYSIDCAYMLCKLGYSLRSRDARRASLHR